jgi:hypothetical protein
MARTLTGLPPEVQAQANEIVRLVSILIPQMMALPDHLRNEVRQAIIGDMDATYCHECGSTAAHRCYCEADRFMGEDA